MASRSSYFFLITTTYERSQTFGFIKAAALSLFSNSAETAITVTNEAGASVTVMASELLQTPTTSTALGTSIILIVCLLLGGLLWFSVKQLLDFKKVDGNVEIDDTNNRLIEGEELRQQTMGQPCSSRLSFAGIALPGKQDVANMMIVGSSGSGKTCSMKEVLASIRSSEKKALVYDRDGAFVSHFYRPEKDIILSSQDARSAAWDIWCECVSQEDYQRMVSILLPEHELENKYMAASRLVLINLAQSLHEEGNDSLPNLINVIEELNTHTVYNILKNTSEASLAVDHDEKTTVSIRGHLLGCIEVMKEAPTEGNRFSVRRWAFNDADDSWLFITSPTDDMDNQRPLKTLWMEFAANTLSQLKPDPIRRCFYVVDDLDGLNKVPSLENLMLLSRKIGVGTILSVKSSSRLNSIYKKETVQTLARSCDNWVALYCDDDQTGDWVSRRLGFKQAIEKTEISLRNPKEKDNADKLVTEKRIACPIITPEMIAALGPMQGYLRFSKDFPIARFNNVPRSWPDVAPAFLPKDEPEEGDKTAEEEENNTSNDDNFVAVPA